MYDLFWFKDQYKEIQTILDFYLTVEIFIKLFDA